MRPLTLLIAGQVADLPASTKGLVKLTQARASLADVTARVGEFSYSFTLPATRANAAIFGADRLHPLGLRKFSWYGDFACELRVGGQVLAGTFRLTSLKNGYTGSFIGESFSWALLLGDTKLTDLVFPLVTYDGSQLETILGQNCDATDLQFPLVAYGNFFSPPTTQTQADGTTKEVPTLAAAVLDYPLSVDDYPPSVYLVNVIRQIFASIGWQVQGRELDSDFWRAVVVLPAGADVAAAWNWGTLLQAEQSGDFTAFSYFAATGANYGNTLGGFDQDATGEVFYLGLAGTASVTAPTRALDPARAAFTAPRNGVYQFEWSADLTGGHQLWSASQLATPYLAYFQSVGLGLVVRRAGQDYTGADGGLCTGPAVINTRSQYRAGQTSVLTPQRLDVAGNYTNLALGHYQGSTGDVYLEAGDVVQLACFARRRFVGGNGAQLIARQEFVTEWQGIRFACTSYTDDNGLSKTQLQPADFLPPLAARDLVKEFLLRTNSFITANAPQKLATILGRSELSIAAGKPLDLSDLVAPPAIEYLPAAGAVGCYVFSPAALSDDPLVSPTADVVTAQVGPGDTSQEVSSLFAVVGFRAVSFPNGLFPLVPTCSTKDGLGQNRSEASWDVAGTAPRLLRYLGPDLGQPLPFMQRTVPLGRAAWDGVLAWEGEAGAVGSYYRQVLKQAQTGHLCKLAVPLSPAQYAGLSPGRQVYLWGGLHTVESVSNWDAGDEGALAEVSCSLEIL